MQKLPLWSLRDSLKTSSDQLGLDWIGFRDSPHHRNDAEFMSVSRIAGLVRNFTSDGVKSWQQTFTYR